MLTKLESILKKRLKKRRQKVLDFFILRRERRITTSILRKLYWETDGGVVLWKNHMHILFLLCLHRRKICIRKSAADFATTQRKYAFDIVFLIEAGYQETKWIKRNKEYILTTATIMHSFQRCCQAGTSKSKQKRCEVKRRNFFPDRRK